jgi:predicted 3-demethylubiquinone-9 3-methyltransferase (glyoxalase superfamily)
MINPIYPCLWFDGQAQTAAEYYCSICGWLKDKYGVAWQIVPAIIGKLMTDPERAPRVIKAFQNMKKFDIATLLKA